MNLDETSSIETLSASQRPGVIVVAVFALLSALALVFMALRIIQLAAVAFLQRDGSTSRPPEILLFRTPIGYYAGCLILSNMFISFAGLIDFSWVSRSVLSQGSACSAQAVLTQIGIWATCWFTSALGVHALISLMFQIHPARWCGLAVATIGWTIALVAGLAPLQKSEVYGQIGPSCGITRSYAKDIFALEALPIILAALVSTAVYSVVFFVLRGKLSLDSLQISRGPDTNQCREGGSEEHHGFIGTIIQTMFWFPLAFVLLLLPFCVTHILMYAGDSVSSAWSVFADVCISMLGVVNVFLLCNTFRVISAVYCGPRSDRDFTDTVETFGHDASFESPIVPQDSRYTIPLDENDHRICNLRHPPSNHSRDPSWASVDSNTELLGSEGASHESVQMKLTRAASNGITPPAWLSRQVGGDGPSPTTSLGLRTRDSFVGRDTGPEPSTRMQQYSFHPMADFDASRKDAKEPTFRSKAPPALDLSKLPHLLLPWDVTNKSATLAARLGMPAASVYSPSQMPAVSTARKLDQGNTNVSALRGTSIPRIEVNIWSSEHADESQPPSSPSSYPCTDCDSDYSGEIMHIRPLPEVPEPNHNEKDASDLRPHSPSCMHARSQRTTMTSVWSQDTAYTLTQPPGAEGEESHKQLVANALVPGVTPGGGADVGRAVRRLTPSGPRPPPKVASSPITRYDSIRDSLA